MTGIGSEILTYPSRTSRPQVDWGMWLRLHPRRYAELLGERSRQHGVKAWLINTGWTGGPPGVGERVAIPSTRAKVYAALDGDLDNVAAVAGVFVV